MRRWTAVAAALALTACSHTLYLTSRATGASGQTTIQAYMGHPTGELTLSLGPRTYAGRWVYVAGPGAVTMASIGIIEPGGAGAAVGSSASVPTFGNGSIIMTSPGGGYLRCIFNYSADSGSDVGGCQDETGGMYDLQIGR